MVGNLSIKDIAHRTAIQTENMARSAPFVRLEGTAMISVSPKIVDEHLRTHPSSPRCDPNLLTWQLPGPWKEASERLANGKQKR